MRDTRFGIKKLVTLEKSSVVVAIRELIAYRDL